MFRLGNRSLNNLVGVSQNMIDVTKQAIIITKVDFGIPNDGGFRTAERQNELYCQGGITRCDGYEKLSRHQSGLAVDFFPYVNGKASYKDEHVLMVACAFLQAGSMLGVPLGWSGLWKNAFEKVHIEELTNV